MKRNGLCAVLCAICLLLSGCGKDLHLANTDANSTVPGVRYEIDVAELQGDIPISIAVDENDTLYIAAGHAVLQKKADGRLETAWDGFHSCRVIAFWMGKLYAVDCSEDGCFLWTLTPGVEEGTSEPLDIAGTPSRMYALDNKLILSCYEESGDGHGYGTGYWVDPTTAETELYPYAAMMYWAVPLENGFLLCGDGAYAADYDGSVPDHAAWIPQSAAGCRMADDGRIYYVTGRTVGSLVWEEQHAVSCGVLDYRFIWQLAGGKDALYAYFPTEGKILCIHETELILEETASLQLLLPETPAEYLAVCIEDYMLQHPGIRIRYEIADAYTMKTRLMAGEDIDIFGVYADQVYGEGYCDAGILEDLGKYPALREIASDPRLIPGILQAFGWEDAWMTVPIGFSVPAMRVLPEVFSSAGIAIPDEDWTWEDFYGLLADFPSDTDGDGYADTVPYSEDDASRGWPLFMDDYMRFYYNRRSSTILFDTEEFRRLMTLWKESRDLLETQENLPDHVRIAVEPVELNINSTDVWASGASDAASYPYRFLARPRLQAEDAGWAVAGYGMELGIYSRSTNKEMAADFLAFVTGYDQRHSTALHVDKAILYKIDSEDAYDHTSVVGSNWYRAFREDDEAFMRYGYPLYEKLSSKLYPSVLTGEMRDRMRQEVAMYGAGLLTLDELIARLTETADMMLR